ncbi:MAG: YjbQ family protein [Candidatus Coatesbacteria bacterium]|nr:MAG: YjbQ family protein [Candidatus Coatesbacteria bacterium]
MVVFRETFSLNSQGDCDIIEITGNVADAVGKSGISEGIGMAFVSHSTAAISCVEYEPGLVSDLQNLYDKLAPKGAGYGHDARWGDGNGHAHVRATLQGPSFAFPVSGGRPVLGTWQQIILMDYDNRPRSREVSVTVVGE